MVIRSNTVLEINLLLQIMNVLVMDIIITMLIGTLTKTINSNLTSKQIATNSSFFFLSMTCGICS